MAEKQKKGKHPGGVMIKDGFSEACAPIISGVITVFLLFLTLVFPLIYHHSYVDILETKYYTYCVIVIGMLAVTLVLALVMLFVDCKPGSCSPGWLRQTGGRPFPRRMGRC